MGAIRIKSFRGPAPLRADHLLPDDAASQARNAMLRSGQLVPWPGVENGVSAAAAAYTDLIRLSNDPTYGWLRRAAPERIHVLQSQVVELYTLDDLPEEPVTGVLTASIESGAAYDTARSLWIAKSHQQQSTQFTTLAPPPIAVIPKGVAGTGPYTYAWSVLIANANVTRTEDAGISTFACAAIAKETKPVAKFRCTVTDAAAATAYVDVQVEFSVSYFNPADIEVDRYWWRRGDPTEEGRQFEEP